MKILRLTTRNFRNLPDQEWKFDQDFQVICGPNEAGKSSLLEALLVGLYGDATSTDSRFAKDRRWNSEEHIFVSLDLQINGDVVTIERDFEDRKNRLIVASKKLTARDKIHTWFEEHLSIQSESAFLETACARQSEIHSDISSSDLGDQIERHALSATGNDLKALHDDLTDEVNEMRRGWQTSAPKNPGPIKRLEDEIARLRMELADLENKDKSAAAALAEHENLNSLVVEMEAACNQDQERLRLDDKYLEAERIYQEKSREIIALQTKIQRLKDISPLIAKNSEQESELQTRLGDLTLRREKALRWKQASARLQELDAALDRLRMDIAALQEVQVTVAELKNPLEGTSLAPQDFAQFQALQKQEQRLLHEMEGDSTEAAQLNEAIAQFRVQSDDSSKELGHQTRRITNLESEKEHAERRERLVFEVRKRADTELRIRSQLSRIRSLDKRRSEIERSLIPLEALERIDLEVFRGHVSSVPTLEHALQNEAIGFEVQPESVLKVTVQIDGAAEQLLTIDQLLTLTATKEIQVRIPGIGRLRLTNQSTIARQLDMHREEVKKVLAQMTVSSEAEAMKHFQERKDLLSQREINAAELRTALEGKPLSDWDRMVQDLVEERDQLNKELESIPAIRALSLIDADLTVERERLSRLKASVAEAQTRISVMSDQLKTVEARVTRRRTELDGLGTSKTAILHAAGKETGTGLQELQESYSAFQTQFAELEEKRGRILQGRREQDIFTTYAEEQRRRGDVSLEVTELSSHALDDSAISRLTLEIQHLQQLVKSKSDETVGLKREIQLLEAEKPQEKYNECVPQLAIADANRKTYEKFTFSDPDKRIAHSSRLQSNLQELASKKERRAEFKVKAEPFGANQERIANLRENLAQREQELNRLKHQFEVDSLVLEYMGKAREKALAELVEAIPSQVGATFSKITDGKYSRVTGERFDLQPWSDQKGATLEVEELSAGTLDQFYLVLRLEALRVTFHKDLPPFILDDVLVSSDSTRRPRLISVLKEYATHGQVLYLTCHDWPELAEFKSLSL